MLGNDIILHALSNKGEGERVVSESKEVCSIGLCGKKTKRGEKWKTNKCTWSANIHIVIRPFTLNKLFNSFFRLIFGISRRRSC